MKVLNLYSGLGGNRKLWKGVDVTAVEKDREIATAYAKNFPEDRIIIGDAHSYLQKEYNNFDFIWSSPPCQTHSKMHKVNYRATKEYPDMKLWQEIIFLDHFFNGKWIVENVVPYYKPLIPGKKIGRHLVWSNFKIGNIQKEFNGSFINTDDPEKLKEWLGIHYEGNIYYGDNHSPAQVLRNCVHPEIGKIILDRARGILTKQNQEQADMFIDKID